MLLRIQVEDLALPVKLALCAMRFGTRGAIRLVMLSRLVDRVRMVEVRGGLRNLDS